MNQMQQAQKDIKGLKRRVAELEHSRDEIVDCVSKVNDGFRKRLSDLETLTGDSMYEGSGARARDAYDRIVARHEVAALAEAGGIAVEMECVDLPRDKHGMVLEIDEDTNLGKIIDLAQAYITKEWLCQISDCWFECSEVELLYDPTPTDKHGKPLRVGDKTDRGVIDHLSSECAHVKCSITEMVRYEDLELLPSPQPTATLRMTGCTDGVVSDAEVHLPGVAEVCEQAGAKPPQVQSAAGTVNAKLKHTGHGSPTLIDDGPEIKPESVADRNKTPLYEGDEAQDTEPNLHGVNVCGPIVHINSETNEVTRELTDKTNGKYLQTCEAKYVVLWRRKEERRDPDFLLVRGPEEERIAREILESGRKDGSHGSN